MGRQKPLYYGVIFFVAIGYGLLAYVIQRHETSFLIPVYGILFLIYLWIINHDQSNQLSFWLVAAFLFRIIFIFSLPSLSDDFYRFIWDGRLWSAGYHPFAELPSTYLQKNISGIDQVLFSYLNSPNYFTIYPPVSQLVFWISVKISPQSVLGSVIVMRLILVIAEAGSIVLIRKLLKRFSLPPKNILLYALNPLVIIELVGNLHFEALIIFFLLLTAYLLIVNKWLGSALSMALAVGTKLLPLIFIPGLVRAMGVKQFIRYGGALIVFILLIFFPLFDQSVFHAMISSVSLYFNKFEFNASLYYLIREYGYWQYGYNTIETTGWKMALVAGILILIFSFRKGVRWNSIIEINSVKTLLSDWMWVLSIYFLFVAILHPWYITTLLVLSIFTSYRFVVVWTGLIFLTYAGYTIHSFEESLWLTASEYVLVIGYLGYESWMQRTHLLQENRIN
jgi:hypothetical protein